MQLHNIVQKQRSFFQTGKTLSEAFRREQLEKFSQAIRDYEGKFFEALQKDLGKPELESLVSETGSVMEEIKLALSNLNEWMKSERVSSPLMVKPGRANIYPEPKGVVLIISPWNYPVSLALSPLVGALAAGNCVVLKPSELSSACSQVLEEMIRATFSDEVVACIQGDVQHTTELLRERFDHIFFTGSPAVGKKIMAAAAEHLTSVTLELGGKSPCIVDPTASLGVTARRIVWGKFFNAGQTCIAPDYVLAHVDIAAKLELALKNRLHDEFGKDPAVSPDYARIINHHHFDRLMGYMSDGKILVGGDASREKKYIAPTILTEVVSGSPIMQEEIFGPILPILTYSTFDEVKSVIRANPNPLALYLFTENSALEQRVVKEIPFGGGCVNDTLLHYTCVELPFGGRGSSGMGAYHGKASFDVFTHHKSVLHRSTLIDPNLRYRPYKRLMSGARWLMS